LHYYNLYHIEQPEADKQVRYSFAVAIFFPIYACKQRAEA